MNTTSFTLIERAPTVAEFTQLRSAVGWENPEDSLIATALANSLYAVCVEHDGIVIGCARVIGDGAMVYSIHDVMVLPAFQGSGVGRMLMAAIDAYLDTNAPAGAFVGLMAARGKAPFYTRLGYIERPSPTYGPGMCRIIGEHW